MTTDLRTRSAANLSVVDERRHCGQTRLNALVPWQHVLLVVVQELVEDSASTVKSDKVQQHHWGRSRQYQQYHHSNNSSRGTSGTLPEDGQLDRPVSSVLLHQADQVLVGVPAAGDLHKKTR